MARPSEDIEYDVDDRRHRYRGRRLTYANLLHDFHWKEHRRSINIVERLPPQADLARMNVMRRATSPMRAPGSSASASILSFASSDQRRLRSVPDMISMRAMKPLCSGINVSTNSGSNARTSPDFPDQQNQFTGPSRSKRTCRWSKRKNEKPRLTAAFDFCRPRRA